MRRKTCNDPKTAIKSKIKKDWCGVNLSKVNRTLDTYSGEYPPRGRRIRCPKCKRRLVTSWESCGDYNCWHEKFPKHKR